MREARLQVASFELSDFDSSMDPKKSIKQYSRSAADAETSLPHELRPEGSLQTTMTYLLHNIMNLCDDDNTSIGDWFHFVWDRTRGIRKDITQQELCSPRTVELVEQCVRFHIHCSARLIAEDPSIFDQKINTENLTKCLQTLKYMYNDLKLKKVQCPNEAEFRAYVVLLNLNESGNFLWEIKQLEKSILNSKELRFALDVYFALANHNYVKFFNLVRKSSYMSACLMLRYFTQVRMKALSIIMRAYTPRKAGFNFSISYLEENLAFEDSDCAVNFLRHHGLMCDVDADIVYLDRSTFGVADTPYQMERAYRLIESKMMSTVAQAICGGPLASPECFQKLVPHSSFDNNGFLKRESYYAEDQNGPCAAANTENVFKVPKGSPPVSPGRSMFQQRPQKSDQTDSSPNENPFVRSTTSNPFTAPKPSMPKNVFKGNFGIPQPEAKPVNPFAQKINFGASQNQSTTQSIFGSSVIANTSPIFASKREISQPMESPSSQLISFAKSVSPATPSKFAASIFGSQLASPTNNETVSFASPLMSSASAFGGFSFSSSAHQTEEAELMRKQQEMELRAEEARRIKEMAQDEERLRKQQELKERLEQKAAENERLRLEAEQARRDEIAAREKAMQESCEAIFHSILGEVVSETVKHEARQSIELFVKIPEEFYDALEFDVVVNEVYQIYRQEFLAYINETKMKYEMMNKCFQHWRQTAKREARRRDKLSTIGCSFLNTSLEQQAEDLHHPEQNMTLSNIKQYLSGSPQSITLPDMNRFKKINLYDELRLKPVEACSRIFWKLIVSIPLKNEEKSLGFSCFINKWLGKTFGETENEDGFFYINEKIMKHSRTRLSICIRKVQGANLLNEKGKASPDIIASSQSIVFYTTSINLRASRKRLQNILDRLELPVPVSIIVYKNQVTDKDEEEISKNLDLSTEVNVSSFEINIYYECHEKSKNLTQVTLDAFQFLSDCHMERLFDKDFKLLDLQMQHMLDFFQITVGDEMWRRVEFSCRQNADFKEHMTSFNCVIHLNNLCVDKLMEIVTNDFRKMPRLPDEFREKLTPMNPKMSHSYEYFPDSWKSAEHQKSQLDFIHGLKLVKMVDDTFKSFDDFKTKFLLFLDCNMVGTKNKVFQSVVAKVIDFLYCQNSVDEDEVVKALNNFCWLKILAEIVVGKFNEIYQRLPENLSSAIIYHKKDLQRYKDAPWWYSIDFTAIHMQAEEPLKKKSKLTPATTSEIQAMLMKSTNSLNKLNSNIEIFKQVSSKTREVSKDFDLHLYSCEENFREKLSEWEEKYKE